MSGRIWLCLLGFVFTLSNNSGFAAVLAEKVSGDRTFSARLSVQPDKPKLSDTITLKITVVPQKISPNTKEPPALPKVDFPAFDKKLGELNIIDIQTTDQQQTITALPVKSGKTPIWKITVQCGDQSVTVPQCEIEITSDISEDAASLDKIDTAANPLKKGHLLEMISAAVLVILVVMVLLFLLRKRFKHAEVPATPLTLQELALQKIAALIDKRLHESDVKEFFVELSDIIRWYLEQKTGIKTPELTTEEFLHKIRRADGRQSKTLAFPNLAAFLQVADVVKFAKHQPESDEIDAAVRQAEILIQYNASGFNQDNSEPQSQDDHLQ